MSQVVEIALFRVREDRLEEGIDVARKLPAEAARFGRIVMHSTLQSVNDPTVFCHIIHWESMAEYEKAFASFDRFPSTPIMTEVMEEEILMEHFQIIG